MANTNKAQIIKLCNEINKREGEGSVYTIGSKHANLKINRWSTGIEDLDTIIGGGMPEGRTIEIFGPESSGKTTLLYHLCSMHDMCLDIPIEGCVDCDTEFFNGVRWKKISEYENGEKVLQYNEDGTSELVLPLKYHKKPCKYLWHVWTKNRLDMVISDHHNVVYRSNGSGKLKIKPFCDMRLSLDWNKDGYNCSIPKTFEYTGRGINLSDEKIRLMVCIFADGSFPGKSNLCYVGLTKKRKIDRMKMLLEVCSINYRIKDSFFIFYAPMNCKHYPKEWYNMSKHQFLIVLDEMQYWDGCQYEIGHVPSFSTVHKSDADFIQFAYTISGYAAYIQTRDRRLEQKYIAGRKIKTEKVSYNVCSGLCSNSVSMRKAKYEAYKTKDGYMYCFTMLSGMWVMRRKDRIIVTGNTFDAARAKVFGNRPKQMLIYRAMYGEDAFNKVINFAKAGIPLIGIDSVPSLIPKDDAEKVLKSASRNSIEEQRIGGTARLMNKYLPTIENIIEVTGTTIIFINQVRDKMDAMMFGEKTQTPGGHKAKHSYSIRIQVARRAWIDIPNKNPKNSATNEHVGLIMKCKVVKSKVCNPGGECEIPLFFDRGFVSFDDIKPIRKELMNQRAEQYGRRIRDIDMDDEEGEDEDE